MKILNISIFLISFFFSTLLNAQEYPWILKQKKDGINIYTRKVINSPILEFKADATIPASLDKVIALFENDNQIPRWYYQCVSAKLLESDGPQNEILYLVMHFPWPVTPRDIIFRRIKEQKPDGSITYTLTALPKKIAFVKGLIRVPSIKSYWVFKATATNQTEIYFQQYANPGGYIPALIINRLVIDTPYNCIKNFRKLVS